MDLAKKILLALVLAVGGACQTDFGASIGGVTAPASTPAAPDPKAEAHYRQGKVFLDSKQYQSAIVEFEAA